MSSLRKEIEALEEYPRSAQAGTRPVNGLQRFSYFVRRQRLTRERLTNRCKVLLRGGQAEFNLPKNAKS